MRCTIEAAVAYLGGMDGVGCWGVLQTKCGPGRARCGGGLREELRAPSKLPLPTSVVWTELDVGECCKPNVGQDAPGVAAVSGRNCTVGPPGLSNRWESVVQSEKTDSG